MNDQMTVPEFAASIKTKYPQYSQIDDQELTNRMLAKYPMYRDKVDTRGFLEQTKSFQPSAAEGPGILERSVEGIGRGLSNIISAPWSMLKAAGEPPRNEQEVAAQGFGGGLGLAMRRMILDPAQEQAEKANTATSSSVALG